MTPSITADLRVLVVGPRRPFFGDHAGSIDRHFFILKGTCADGIDLAHRQGHNPHGEFLVHLEAIGSGELRQKILMIGKAHGYLNLSSANEASGVSKLIL